MLGALVHKGAKAMGGCMTKQPARVHTDDGRLHQQSGVSLELVP